MLCVRGVSGVHITDSKLLVVRVAGPRWRNATQLHPCYVSPSNTYTAHTCSIIQICKWVTWITQGRQNIFHFSNIFHFPIINFMLPTNIPKQNNKSRLSIIFHLQFSRSLNCHHDIAHPVISHMNSKYVENEIFVWRHLLTMSICGKQE